MYVSSFQNKYSRPVKYQSAFQCRFWCDHLIVLHVLDFLAGSNNLIRVILHVSLRTLNWPKFQARNSFFFGIHEMFCLLSLLPFHYWSSQVMWWKGWIQYRNDGGDEEINFQVDTIIWNHNICQMDRRPMVLQCCPSLTGPWTIINWNLRPIFHY